jgi:hypothetical protein
MTHLRCALERERAAAERITMLHPRAEYHEDFGDVLWWTVPISEPPFVGSPQNSDWDDEEMTCTHFSLLPNAVAHDKLSLCAARRGEGLADANSADQDRILGPQ